MHECCRRYASEDNRRFDSYAEALGVSVESLVAHECGLDSGNLTFPHRRRRGGRPIGLRIRGEDGGKYFWRGSKPGLLFPSDAARPESESVWITEGESDALAGWDVGLDCVGRPSADAGARDLRHVFEEGRRIVIVGDRDAPGIVGAKALLELARLYDPLAKIVLPADECKDLREHLLAGKSPEQMEVFCD